jgi:DNA-binding NarL/FixJ family response regulator
MKMKIFLCICNLLLCEALEERMQRDPVGWQIASAQNVANISGEPPDLILVDPVNLDHELFSRWPDAKFILIDTGVPPDEMANLMCIYRLDGVLSTDTDFRLFKRAVRVILDGQIWIDNEKLKALLRSKTNCPSGAIERLTCREKQVMESIVAGCKNREIAEKLFLSEQTVKSHVNRIFRKFGVTCRSQLVSLFVIGRQQ